MHIRQAIFIEATPEMAMEAARTWMRHELHELGSEVVENLSPAGAFTISSAIVQDGIRMTTLLTATPNAGGAKLALDLRTEGVDLGARLRNISLLPGKRLVTRQTRASLQEIKANAEE